MTDTTNVLKVVATDDGTPILSETNAFTAVVNALAPALVTPLGFSGSQFQLQVSGTMGPDYFLLASTNLVNWSDIATNFAPVPPFQFTDPHAGSFTNRAYRVRLGP
jgi:hypothetical protein